LCLTALYSTSDNEYYVNFANYMNTSIDPAAAQNQKNGPTPAERGRAHGKKLMLADNQNPCYRPRLL